MSFRIARVKHLFTFILTVLLVLACTGCDSKPVATTDAPQAGKWAAEFSTKIDGEKDYNWKITFQVSGDGKQASDIEAEYYQGELAPGAQLSTYHSAGEPSIEKNSFEFTIYVSKDYYQAAYECEVIFTSATEAKGTIRIDDKEHKWEAASVSE